MYRATDLTEIAPRMPQEDAVRGVLTRRLARLDTMLGEMEHSIQARINPDDPTASPSHHTILPYGGPFRTNPLAHASSNGTIPIYSSYGNK